MSARQTGSIDTNTSASGDAVAGREPRRAGWLLGAWVIGIVTLTGVACHNRPTPVASTAGAALLRAPVPAPPQLVDPETGMAAATQSTPDTGQKPALAQSRPAGPGLAALKARDVTDTSFGIAIADPYRHLEQVRAADVVQWMKAESNHTQRSLERIPGRNALLDKLRRYEEAVPARVSQVVRTTGNRWFFERRGARDNQFKLYMRERLQGRDRLLVDPDAMGRRSGKPHAINFFSPSPNGRHVAYGVSRQGNESSLLHILDTATGRAVGSPIERANIGGLAWSPDSKTLLFNRLQLLQPDAPETERYQRSRVWRLRVGAPETEAEPVFGTNTAGVQIRAAEIPVVQLSHDGRWAFGLVLNGTQRELTVYLADQSEVLGGKPRWRRLIDPQAQVTAFSYFNNALYTLSHLDAPRSKIAVLPLASQAGHSSDFHRERVLVSQSDRVLTGIAAAADALYVEARDGNTKRLFSMGYAPSSTLREVRLPIDGAFSLQGEDASSSGAADPRLPGVLIALESWTQARQIVLVGADGHATNTGLQPSGSMDAPANLAVTEVRVPTPDGAQVPMTLIHRKGLVRDGNNPTLLYGYAAYGVTEEPFFSHSRLAWLDAGGIFAVANPRGSGVFGEDWYRAGFQTRKHNSWEDFIACAQYLVAQRYTKPQRLGILGTSAGAIVVGRAMTERPDLFAAVIASVGALDMIRSEQTPNGIPNIPEFGSSRTEAGLRARLAMSTYHQVRDRTAYPAVLLTHGVNDPRVDVWQSTKTAARLKAASTSGKPVLLRLDFDAGHGVGSTKDQILREQADIFSFLLWQLGQTGFQPVEPNEALADARVPGRKP